MSFFLWIAGGFSLGLLSAGHCLGMCGPIAFFIGSGRNPNEQSFFKKISPFLWLSAGKALTYGWIGLIFGWAGVFLTRWSQWMGFAKMLPVAAGVSMIATGLYVAGAFPKFHVRLRAAENGLGGLLQSLRHGENPAALFAAGMLWGLLPCPMVLVPALGAAISGGSGGAPGALRGFFMMAGFGLGTLPAIAAGGLGGGYLLKNLRRHWKPVWAGLGLAGVGVVLIVFSTFHCGTSGQCCP